MKFVQTVKILTNKFISAGQSETSEGSPFERPINGIPINASAPISCAYSFQSGRSPQLTGTVYLTGPSDVVGHR